MSAPLANPITSIDTPVIPQKTPLGTFFGVFLPTSLSIFGIMLYLRLGWIVGAGGLIYSVAIISLATLITLTTSFSIASTSSNMMIGKGGVYFVLSRTFGIEAGCAIGIPLIIAQILSISLYMVGLGEGIHAFYPAISSTNATTGAFLLVFIISQLPLKILLKTQLTVFILIGLSLLSIALGLLKQPFQGFSNIFTLPTWSFWGLFSIFFPAVTGVESGLAMTADLKKPGRSLALGSFTSVMTGYLIYLGLAVLLGLFVNKDVLSSNTLIMTSVAQIPLLALIGLFCAGISGSLSLFLTIPKTLQALGDDGLIPKFIGKEIGKDGSARIAIIVVAIFAYLGILLGGLEKIAALVTMFFLLSYAMLNIATGIEAMIANPSWRPKVKTPWWISLGGGFLCIIVMLMINPGTSLTSLFFVSLIYIWMKKRHVSGNWEDLRHSVLLFLSRFAIYRLATSKPSAKTWRPSLMVFVDRETEQDSLVELTSAITHRQGFLIYAQIRSTDLLTFEPSLSLSKTLKDRNIPALTEVFHANSVFEGIKIATQNYGLGPLVPNTFVFAAPKQNNDTSHLSEIIAMSYLSKKNLVLIKAAAFTQKEQKKRKEIHVWWGGRSKLNSQYMIVIAHMLQTSQEWKGATVYLKTIAKTLEDYARLSFELDSDIQKGRLSVIPKIYLQVEGEDTFKDTIYQNSKQADLLFLGIKAPEDPFSREDYASYLTALFEKTENYPKIAFVLASEEIAFDRILC